VGIVSESGQVSHDGEPVLYSTRCPRCGELAEFLDSLGLSIIWDEEQATLHWTGESASCHRCRIAAADPSEVDAMRAHYGRILFVRDRIGIPPEVTLYLWRSEPKADAPARLQGLHVLLFGIRVQNWPKESRLPTFRFQPDNGQAPYEFVFPQVVVGTDDLPVALECRWSTESILSPASALEIVGWQNVTKLSDLQRLVAGVEILRPFERRGRPAGTTSVREDQFREHLPMVYADLMQKLGRHPSLFEIADAFYVSHSTVKRYKANLIRAGGTWPPISHY
jgi:hypothetical protein